VQQKSVEPLQTKSFWNSYMKSYDYLGSVSSYRDSLYNIAKAAQVNAGDRILDAGSGTGNLSMLLKSLGGDVTSLDFSEDALAIHRSKDPQATVICHSLEECLPFRDGAFDTVCCASVLFSLSEKGCRTTLTEFFRVLQPGGTLVITAASPRKKNRSLLRQHLTSAGWKRVLGLILDVPSIVRVLYFNMRLQRFENWQGYHRFTETELSAACSSAGFRDVNVALTYGESFFLVTARK